jgi:ADP-heptose:LPS heptosyltransferase
MDEIVLPASAPRIVRFARAIGARLPSQSRRSIVRKLMLRAHVEREARRFAAAQVLYEQAMDLAPHDPRVMMQYAHLLKEKGDYAAAEPLYLAVERERPADPDVAIQLGHFYKLANRPERAATAYARAVELRPGWAEAQEELARVGGGAPEDAAMEDKVALPAALVPEMLPVEGGTIEPALRTGFHVRRLGATRAFTRGGYRRVLRGVEAVHGFLIGAEDVDMLDVYLDGVLFHREPLIRVAWNSEDGQAKHVFNAWIDLSAVPPGPCKVELRAARPIGPAYAHHAMIDVLPPLRESDAPASDAVVEGNAFTHPSMIRPAQRSLLPTPRAILVQRIDQLGDLSCSIAALARLRAHFPEAQIVLLTSLANADLARSLPMVDEVVVQAFVEGAEGRKLLAAEDQQALRDRLATYTFDVAIDLGETGGSRPVLLLSGARFLYGFKGRDFPWLDAGFDLDSHDLGNHIEAAAVSHKFVAMVDGLAQLTSDHHPVIVREDLDRSMLADLGIDPASRYILLHTGTRLPFIRWPGYAELAEHLLARTDLDLVVIGDEPWPGMPASPRIKNALGRMPFDRFDALLSFATLFIGNDSGPKHLAALRGVPTVSIHCPRTNWSEWGQTGPGFVISRRVPCAGCGIHAEEDCGKDVTCVRSVAPAEVLDAALRLL